MLGYEQRALIEYRPNFRLIDDGTQNATEQAARSINNQSEPPPLDNGATTPKTVSARMAGKEPAAIDSGVSRSGENAKTGDFGVIFEQFKGKPKEAIDHLLKVKEGEAIGALHNPQIGEIDLVWGNNVFGLKHIYDRRLQQWQDEAKVLDFIHKLPKIIEESAIDEAQSYAGRAVLVNPKYTSVIELTYNNANKKWLMTAYRDSSNKRNPFAQKVHGEQITTEPNRATQSSTIDGHISSIGTANETIQPTAPKSQVAQTPKGDRYELNTETSEIGDGKYGLWIKGDGDTFIPAAGTKVTLNGLKEFNFALVRVGDRSKLYNVETGLVVAEASNANQALKEANAALLARGESKSRDIINDLINIYGALPKREANPKPAPNLTYKSLSPKYRRSVENADKYYDQEIAKHRSAIDEIGQTPDNYLMGKIKYLQKEINDVERRKAALKELKDADIYAAKLIDDGKTEYEAFKGLLYDYNGVSFGIYRKNGYFYVVEAESAAPVSSRQFFFAAFNDLLDYLALKTPQEFRSAVDKYVAKHGRTPFKPNATTQAKAQTPNAATDAPKAREAKAAKPIAQEATPAIAGVKTTQTPTSAAKSQESEPSATPTTQTPNAATDAQRVNDIISAVEPRLKQADFWYFNQLRKAASTNDLRTINSVADRDGVLRDPAKKIYEIISAQIKAQEPEGTIAGFRFVDLNKATRREIMSEIDDLDYALYANRGLTNEQITALENRRAALRQALVEKYMTERAETTTRPATQTPTSAAKSQEAALVRLAQNKAALISEYESALAEVRRIYKKTKMPPPNELADRVDDLRSQLRAIKAREANILLSKIGVNTKAPDSFSKPVWTIDGYRFNYNNGALSLTNEIKRDPSFAYKRALDDAKMSEKFLSRRLANGEKELEGELNALRNDIANLEKKIAEKETPKSQAAETTRTNAPETTPIREAAQPQNKDALISKYEANIAEFKRMRQEIRQTPLHERAPDWQKTHDELTSMIVDTQARINALDHKVVFDEAAKEIGDSGGFRFWLLQRQEGYKTLFAPAVGSKITFDGFNDLNFALVKNAGHYRVYNVDTGRALTGYRPKASEVIAEVKERLRRQNGRKKIEAIIDQDGVLPAREPKPKAPISATVERVNNETKHIPANFREYVRKAIIQIREAPAPKRSGGAQGAKEARVFCIIIIRSLT